MIGSSDFDALTIHPPMDPEASVLTLIAFQQEINESENNVPKPRADGS